MLPVTFPMNLSEIFIRRPVMTTLIMIGIVIFGVMSYVLLPISPLPNVEYPFISVSASLPGATPETMASSVAAPLERQFTEIAGLNSFNSTSSTGASNISLQFDFSRSVASAAKDVLLFPLRPDWDIGLMEMGQFWLLILPMSKQLGFIVMCKPLVIKKKLLRVNCFMVIMA